MSALVIPPPGSSVRVMLRAGDEVFGDILEARISGERIAVAIWGTGRSLTLDPAADIRAIEVVELTSARVLAIASRQRMSPEFAPRMKLGTFARPEGDER